MNDEIVLYTIHCVRCNILETKLNQKNIAYTKCDDMEKMKELGIKSAPYLSVNGVLMDYTKAIN